MCTPYPVNLLLLSCPALLCVLMPWELISQIVIVPGSNLLFQGNKNLFSCAWQFDSDVTLISRYRGYVVQSEVVDYGFSPNVNRLATRRVELWSSFQYSDMDNQPNARYIQFVPESKSSDIGKVLSMWAFQ